MGGLEILCSEEEEERDDLESVVGVPGLSPVEEKKVNGGRRGGDRWNVRRCKSERKRKRERERERERER